jgi:hypothetical protein
MAAQLGLPPGYRFVPTDEELVRLHLLPCILDQPQPRNDIIVDDPLSAPPWALLEKHGRKQEAFFFAVGQAMNAKGNRQKRTCEGHGTWQGQGKRKREEEGKESKKRMRVSVCGSTKEIEWEKYGLNFQERGVKGSNDEDDDEVDDATLATTWCAAEEDPALFIGEYPLAPQAEYVTSLPMAVADVVNAIPADGSGAGAGMIRTCPRWCWTTPLPGLLQRKILPCSSVSTRLHHRPSTSLLFLWWWLMLSMPILLMGRAQEQAMIRTCPGWWRTITVSLS